MKDALLAAIAKTPAPTRAQTQRRRWIALGIGGAVALGLFAKIGMHPGERPVAFVVVCALALAALALRASWLAVVAMCAITVNYALTGTTPASTHVDIACATFTGIFTLVIGSALLVAFKSSDPVQPERRGVRLALTATTLAATFLFLICECDEARHFAVAHVASALVVGFMLALVARRVVAVR